MKIRSLLDGLPTEVGVYNVGSDATVEILEAEGTVKHERVRGALPAATELEASFKSGPVLAYKITDAIVDVQTGAVFDSEGSVIREAFGTKAVLDRYLKNAPSLDSVSPISIGETLLPLATTRSDNYCRWWFDSMAKSFIIEQSVFAKPSPTIISPALTKKFQLESVTLLDDIRIVRGGDRRFFRADVVNTPGVTYNGGQRIGSIVADVGRSFGAELAAANRKGRPASASRIFISREEAGVRRIVNEAELRQALIGLDFEIVILERLSLVEQAAVIAAADVIVSPHGAGLTNLLWSHPKATLVEIFPEGGVHGSAFLRVAAQLGLEYYCVVGQARENRDKKGNPNNADIEVDVAAVRQFVEDLLDRNVAERKV